MRIVVIGAGAVGSYLAERLSAEGQDVVVVEADKSRAAELQAKIDALVVTGNGASPGVLEEAGIDNADLLIAVTSSDAVNLLACHAGSRLGVPRKVARVEDPALRTEIQMLGVDVMIDPVDALAEDLLSLVKQGGVTELTEFADGKLTMIGGFVPEDAPVAMHTLGELRASVTGWYWLVVALIRNGITTVARGDVVVNPGDHVVAMAKTGHTDEAVEFLGLREHEAHKVAILGGTRLAQLTASKLASSRINTLVVDVDPAVCRQLAEQDARLVVVCGDPTDPDVLRAEGIASADVVLALTGWDEVNLLGCIVAKALGVETAVARFNRFELVGLLPGVGIDFGVSSRLSAANQILRFVRRGHIHSVATFQDSDAEAIDLQVDEGSPAVGRPLADLKLPKSIIVGGVLRGEEAFVPHGNTIVEAGDRMIVFAEHDSIASVEELFG